MRSKTSLYFLTYVVLLGWVAFASQSISGNKFILPSILGLSAYCLMWGHYFNGVIRDYFLPEVDTKKSYQITKAVVLPAFLIHSLAVSYIVTSSGYGLPPKSYINYFGSEKFIFIIFGVIGITFLIAFDFKQRLSKEWQDIIGHASNLAVLLISIHALALGYVLKQEANRMIFYALVISLILMLSRLYIMQKNQIIKYTGLVVIALVVVIGGYLIFKPTGTSGKTEQSKSTVANSNIDSGTPQNSTSQTQINKISSSDLAKNNGKDGNDCWVAVDGQVYNLSKSRKWKNGEHTEAPNRGVECGKDLSDKIGQSPHGKSILADYPIVGTY